jgi:hypothetical protein
MADKPRPTLADYFITAISPVLIIALVGSLVFFLVEILYAGRYEGRLLWTLFFFVVGTVLIARISIQADPVRASFYGLGLLVVTWMALFAFIKYPEDSAMSNFAGLINLFLMGLIFWSANKLTWDCTFIDEKRESSSRGLLSAAGFEQRPETAGQTRETTTATDADAAIAPDVRQTLGQRWSRYRESRRKRPHTPGLTVVWFSLAALPIFGLGESLIPANDAGRRAFCFQLAAVYVAAALGLLLTTSFLGLRRYLRQRRAPMPRAMAGAWLGIGTALVIGFIVAAALLPRPFSETPIWDLKKLTSAERKSSKHSPLRDGGSEGDGRSGEGRGPQKADQKGGGAGQQADDRKENGEPGGDKRTSSPNGKSESGSGAGKFGVGDQNGKQDDAENKDAGDKKGDGQPKNSVERTPPPSSDQLFPDTRTGHFLDSVLNFLKWLVFALFVLLVLGVLLLFVLKHFANFMPWAHDMLAALRAWWERLWGKPAAVASAQAIATKRPRRPFSSFSNPFADGTGEGRSAEELVKYSFAALEAWAADRNHPRRPDETPLEFTSRLGNMFVSLEGHPRRLALLVVRLAYADGILPADARQTLEFFWDNLTSTMPAAAVD